MRAKLLFCVVVLGAVLLSWSTGFALEVTLEWTPNVEPDVSGYIVRWSETSGAPYEGMVDAKDVNLFTVIGLDSDKEYFFVLTAYDRGGYESDFSHEVNTEYWDGVAPGIPCLYKIVDIVR